jgi:hypothetical protein
MSDGAISAVNWTSSDPMDRYRTAREHLNLASLDPTSQGAHLTFSAPMQTERNTFSLNITGLHTSLAEGLRNGFRAEGSAKLMDLMLRADQPGNTVTPGELYATLHDAQAKGAMGDVLAKLCNKTVEGLQTLVVKQG